MNGVSAASSSKMAAGPVYSNCPGSMPSRCANRLPTSQTIHQSGRLSPTGGMAGRTRCTRRSLLVKVPSFSAKEVAGSTTSASSVVSWGKMSCTTRNCTFDSACCACARYGSLSNGFSPVMYIQARSPRAAAAIMSVTTRPSSLGSGAAQSRSNGPRVSSVRL